MSETVAGLNEERGGAAAALREGILGSAVLSLKGAGMNAHVDAAIQTEDAVFAAISWVYDPE